MGLLDLPLNMLSKVTVNGTCWDWTGAKNSKGYPCVTDGHSNSVLAHRKSYELLVGPIPDGLELDHLCRNIICIRPDHLEPVTGTENARRRWAAYTECRRGHAMTPDNVRIHRRRNGRTSRECISCISVRRAA